MVDVDLCPVIERRAVARSGADVDVAAGDCRDTGRAHGDGRARMQLAPALVEPEAHDGLAVVGQVEALDAAGLHAADTHEVARNELTGVLHLHLELAGVAARDDEHKRRERNEERGESERAHGSTTAGNARPRPGYARPWGFASQFLPPRSSLSRQNRGGHRAWLRRSYVRDAPNGALRKVNSMAT